MSDPRAMLLAFGISKDIVDYLYNENIDLDEFMSIARQKIHYCKKSIDFSRLNSLVLDYAKLYDMYNDIFITSEMFYENLIKEYGEKLAKCYLNLIGFRVIPVISLEKEIKEHNNYHDDVAKAYGIFEFDGTLESLVPVKSKVFFALSSFFGSEPKVSEVEYEAIQLYNELSSRYNVFDIPIEMEKRLSEKYSRVVAKGIIKYVGILVLVQWLLWMFL